MDTRFAILFVSMFLLCASFLGSADAGPIAEVEAAPYGLIRPESAVLLLGDGSKESLPTVGFDGTGLSSFSPLRGVHSTEVSGMVSVPVSDVDPVTIRYDLGNEFSVNELWLWQYNAEGETDRGMKDFDIVFRNTNGNVVSEIAAATVGIANAGNLPASYFCPVAEDVRYVELVIRENYGDTEFVGLSEIA
ncbi:MAG: hypothetical protein KDB27_36455, partial [Planctomycetales bacterium]|nr:hypothetical protein [Planctomycetales bacterium]